MILSEPPMSNSSGLHVPPTPVGQSLEFGKNGWKMLISLQNMSFLSKKNMIFCLKNLIFSEYEWAIANLFWEWNKLSNVIYFQNKVWHITVNVQY